MKKNIMIFGLVLGTILCVNMIYMVYVCYTNPNFESNDLLGYTAMVVIFSLIFFGVKNYRDKQLGGRINFGNAFKQGSLIALVGSIIYVIVWLFLYYLVVPDYLDKYIPHVLKEAATHSPSELDAKVKEMENFRKMYENPLFVILITLSEVLPIGLIVSLISALVLQRKNLDQSKL